MILKIKSYKILSFWALSSCCSYAQTQGVFDLRLSLKNADCKSGKVTVGVEVKATNQQQVFNMGDANIRFEYDALKLQAPVIVSQDNFASAKNRSYGTQNLNGSREANGYGIVSLNTFYTASNGDVQKIGDAWMPISTIGFDMKDYKNPTELRLHNDKIFPISGMSQVEVTVPNPAEFEYNLKPTKPSENFTNLMFDPRKSCPSNVPFAENVKLRIKKNNQAFVNIPILDLDENDIHTVEIASVNHGKATPSVSERLIKVEYQPQLDFMGKDEIQLRISDKYGNITSASISITVSDNGLVVYNGFSPNNDGKNDYLTIEGLENYKQHKLSVYNTNGVEMYVSNNYKNDWDGTFNGKILINGTYLYILEADDEVIKNYIQIER